MYILPDHRGGEPFVPFDLDLAGRAFRYPDLNLSVNYILFGDIYDRGEIALLLIFFFYPLGYCFNVLESLFFPYIRLIDLFKIFRLKY